MSTQKMNHLIRLRDGCSNVKKIKPVLDVATRWNSTYYMIDKAIELRTPLTMIISTDADLQPFLLSDDEWNYLRRMKVLLEVKLYYITFISIIFTICSYYIYLGFRRSDKVYFRTRLPHHQYRNPRLQLPYGLLGSFY
jgi:hypothetical protein